MAKNNNSDDTEKLNVENPKHKIGEFTSIEDFTKDGFSSIVEATKAINQFPTGASRDLYCAYPTFSKIVGDTSERILEVISRVLKHEHIRGNIQRRQQDEQFELLTECNDVMLEKINSNLDEMAGIKRNLESDSIETPIKVDIVKQNTKGIGSWNLSKTFAAKPSHSQSSLVLLNTKNIPRPQLNFKVPIDNSSDTPFEPKIKEKPNALKPLAILPEYDEDGNIEGYIHPYEFELLKFESSIGQFEKKEPTLPKYMDRTAFELIETKEQLEKMIYNLRDIHEIAVDVEHHSHRSFMGISCLVQLSTKLKDYIIDGLKLRDDLYLLNEIFTNPKITKIFHGADLDVQWLQRDFGVYIVNMFDTHQAARILGLPRLSLAFLLKHYCDVDAEKIYQLADWRIRPLPAELIYYARQDTHYLIYIYELICNELINKGNDQSNLIKMVYQRSSEICKKRYVKPKISPDSHMDLYRKSKKIFDNRQLFALKEIFQWRDHISRKEDESYNYVLPNHMMLQIAEILPREMQGILACCNPIPPLVRQNLHPLHQIILKARDQPLIKPIIYEQIENRVINTMDMNGGRSYCPHDMFQNLEFRDDLPTLLNSQGEYINKENPPVIVEPRVNVFENLKIYQEESIKNKLAEIKKVKFITPYERYKAIIPYAEKLNLEEIEKQEAIRKSMQLCPASQENSPQQAKEEKNNSDKVQMKNDLKRKRDNSSSSSQAISSKKKKLTSPTSQTDNNDSKIKNNYKKEQNIGNNNASKETDKVENPDVQEIKEGNGETIIVSSDSDNEVQQTKAQVTQETISTKTRLGTQQNRKKNRNKLLPKLKTAQSSNQQVQFDYSNIDFKKFQGGVEKMQATSSSTSILKSKFHPKGKTATNISKKFNKIFSFSKSGKK